MQQLKKLTVGVALAALMGTALAACGGADNSGGVAGTDSLSANLPKSDADIGAIDKSKVKKTLVVGVDNPYYLFHEDFVIAQEKGYFKEFGIDKVTVKTLDDPLPGLIGGSLDLANFDTDTSIAAAKKSNSGVRYLAVYLGGEANILGCRKGINSAADLKGTTITGGQFGSRNDAITRQLLQAHGVDPSKDVKMVSTGGQSDSRLQAVIAGTVDCASLQLRHKVQLEKAGGKFLFQTTDQVPQNGWAGDKLIKDSPDTIAAFLAATLKARQFATDQANKTTVLDMMKQAKFEITPDFSAAYSAENAPTYHTVDGSFKPADMDKFINDQIGFKVVPKGTDWRAYTWLEPLWKAQKALGVPLNPSISSIAQDQAK
jgi:ABC-type nitrate/sulfonate/bicarbonate transport system substrate-binding protein